MSEALSSVEIEDVLSSIRRLVSEDLRPDARLVQPAATVAAVANPLILTPSLRVVPPPEPDSAWEEEEAQWVEEPVALTPLTWDAAEEAAPQVEAAAADPAPEPMPHRFTLTGAPLGDEAAREEAARDEAADDAADPLYFAPDVLILQARSPVLTLTPAMGVAADATEDDVAPWAQASDDDLISDPLDRVAAAPTMDDSDLEWADQAAAEAIAGLTEQVETAAMHAFHADLQDDDAPADDGAEVTYDETLLRDLVRDIIREELAGGLGEKITRNVRKLVRAEIALALATRDFD